MKKRLFFAFDLKAPWQKDEPSGRIVKNRHITLIHLGEMDLNEENFKKLKSFPKPSFEIAPCGFFNNIIFLPTSIERVLAYTIFWLNDQSCLKNYRKILFKWLKKNNFILEEYKERKFLEHVTICRTHFDKNSWLEFFKKIPMEISKLTLYESLGNQEYKTIKSYSLEDPFLEIKHTADIAFRIKGKDFNDLFFNAFSALCFKFPKLINYFSLKKISFKNIEDVIVSLNLFISKADIEIGVPFKGISFTSDIYKKNDIINWEMIVDV